NVVTFAFTVDAERRRKCAASLHIAQIMYRPCIASSYTPATGVASYRTSRGNKHATGHQCSTIAVLDWGPTNLAFVQPREPVLLKGFTWLPEGPELPPFLGTVGKPEWILKTQVRYALSQYTDLQRCIRNLQRCYNFPYPEAVGY
ncbi:unnamed protein product, partial [Amoebophrya sp. A120]